MQNHYSKPKGFVGRNICYAIYYNNIYYGHIVAGSATKHLPNRNSFFNISGENLNIIVNNIFYNITKVNNKYPKRNFTTFVLKNWINIVKKDWFNKYGDYVTGFETLVELPRTGECYKKAKWQLISQTKGFTCKRTGGKGTDNWTGKRIWNTNILKPKLVFCLKNI